MPKVPRIAAEGVQERMAAMFGKSQPPRREGAEIAADTVFSSGTVCEGTLSIEGSARIEGKIVGSLRVAGLLVVARGAELQADVDAGEARVSGTIRGNLRARESVELLEGSRLEGDVFTKCFRIEAGAFFQGDCHMGEVRSEGVASL
jgi:cytoskeletal protein CcmA (bactofilin family)